VTAITRGSSLAAVATAVGDALRREGIRGVLTGGACASLHSGGVVQSSDIDFVLPVHAQRRQLDVVLARLGFHRDGDRYVHPRSRFYLEFPKGPLGIGADRGVRPRVHRVGRAALYVLAPTDSCRDRLAAFYHWQDRQGLEAAVAIAVHRRVDLKRIRSWSLAEGHAEDFEAFRFALQRARARRRAMPSSRVK
jgi:hypothetical protein